MEKMCPILTAAFGVDAGGKSISCEQSKCAWWKVSHDRDGDSECAILAISIAITRLAVGKVRR